MIVNDVVQLLICVFLGFLIIDVMVGVLSTSYYLFGLIFVGVVDLKTLLMWGLLVNFDLYFDGSLVFLVNVGVTGVMVLVSYLVSNVLCSGWLFGENVIVGKTVVANVAYGDG